MTTIEQYIQQYRQNLDSAAPGAYGWEQLDKTLNRLPQADALELQILCDRSILDHVAVPSGLWERISQELDAPKTDALELFIGRNRAGFDAQQPPSSLWNRLEPSLPQAPLRVHKINWGRHLMSIAAAISLLIIGLSAGIWYGGTQSRPAKSMAMSEVSHEYAELEQYYQGDIAAKRGQLAQFTGSQSVEVNEDLVQLDLVMEELQRELIHVPPGNREQVIRAMIENYKAKAAILQRVLERLQQSLEEADTSQKTSPETKNI